MIKNLINAKKFQQPILLKGNSLHQLKKFLEMITIIRKTEQESAFVR